jgi:hypothetical protein
MDQIEPYRQIVQLQAQIVKISRRNGELRKRCEELEEALTVGVVQVTVEETPVEATISVPKRREPWWLKARLRISRAISLLSPFRWLRV